jgi:hypothetical protein
MKRLVGLASLLMLVAPSAQAASVYLNGVNIDGASNQQFDGAKVRLDEKGNVHIDAPGYAVKAVEAPVSPPPSSVVGPARLTRRYFMLTQQAAPGMAEYEVDVFINSKWIRKVPPDDNQQPLEITRYLVPGRNNVLLMAKKVMRGTRKSYSPTHEMKIIVGEGNVGGDHLMMDTPLITFSRTAADTQDTTQEYTLTTR